MKYALAFVILICTDTLCQELKSVEKYFVSPGGELLRICSDGKMLNMAGYQFGARHRELLFQSGKNILLKPLESVRSFAGNMLLTTEIDSAYRQHKLSTYTLAGDKLTLAGSISQPVEHSATQLQNGNIVIKDFYEGAGSYIEIYTPDLKLLRKYVPYDRECAWNSFAANENYLVAVFGFDDNKNVKVATFNVGDGKLISEFRVVTEITGRVQVLPLKDRFVLYGYSSEEGYDMSGKKLWTVSDFKNSGEGSVVADDSFVYVFTNTDLVAIDGTTGKVRWRKSLAAEFGRPAENQKRISPVQFIKHNDGVGFVLAMTSVGSLDPVAVKTNSKYVQYNNAGEQKYNVMIPGDRKFIHVSKAADGLRIVTDTDVYSYKDTTSIAQPER